jgi:hypothetical protein
MKKATLSFIFSFLAFAVAFAQDNGAEMADNMRKEGKIYVVIAVILTIFAGLVLFLVRLDRKISKLEKSA